MNQQSAELGEISTVKKRGSVTQRAGEGRGGGDQRGEGKQRDLSYSGRNSSGQVIRRDEIISANFFFC